MWGLVFKVAVDFHRRQLYGAFDFCREKSYLNLNKFSTEDAFPPALSIPWLKPPPSSLSRAHSNLYLALSFSRRRCRKSRVHFPHFSPSWRAARATGQRGEVLKKSCVGRRVGGRMPGRETLLSEGCETSPLRRNRDILPRYYALILQLLRSSPPTPFFSKSSRFARAYPQDLL